MVKAFDIIKPYRYPLERPDSAVISIEQGAQRCPCDLWMCWVFPELGQVCVLLCLWLSLVLVFLCKLICTSCTKRAPFLLPQKQTRCSIGWMVRKHWAVSICRQSSVCLENAPPFLTNLSWPSCPHRERGQRAFIYQWNIFACVATLLFVVNLAVCMVWLESDLSGK